MQICQFYVQNLVFSCLAKSHFKHKIFKDTIPAYSWKPRFFNLMCKPHRNSVFWCLPKGISNRRFEDIQIHYSSPPLQSQILQFYVQNSVCWGIPKGILNRWFSNILFLPTPESVDFIFLQNSIFDAFPKAFQIEDIQIVLFLRAPEHLDSPILDAKLGVLRPSQRHFK